VDNALIGTTEFDIFSLNPATCVENWRTHEDYPPSLSPTNRGAAYMDGMLFRGAQDGRVLAYDFKTGKRIWETTIADPKRGESVPSASIVWDGLVFVGNAGGDFKGAKGHMFALDAKTGKIVWEFFLVPKAEGEAARGPLGAAPPMGQIGEGGLPTGIFTTVTRVPKSFAKSGKIKLQLSPRQKPNGGYFTPDDSRAEVARLAAARQLVGEIAAHSAARCKQLERSSKINDRSADYGKQYFVLRIVEAWIWLTGKGPGLGNLPEKNPCLRFVNAALLDAGIHSEKSAWRALEAALKWFDRMWMVPETLQTIASIGPDWADTFRATTNIRPVKG
jgi:hypothetical protein